MSAGHNRTLLMHFHNTEGRSNMASNNKNGTYRREQSFSHNKDGAAIESNIFEWDTRKNQEEE